MLKRNTYPNIWIATLIIIFLLVAIIGYLTPKNPDDYGYYLLGLSFEKHLHHYLTWSGRIIIDYFSSAVMALQNNIVIALINSLAVPLLIYNLVTLPNYNNQRDTNKYWIIGCLLFITYWLTNPALGESTFWVVGAANYLWPLVIISLYIKYLLKYLHQQKISHKQYTFVYLLAFISGCSNEAVSVTVCYLTLCLIFFALINKFPNKKLAFICLFLVMLGSALLILAPGNFNRASDPIFNDWKALTLSQRLVGHFTGTFPQVLKSYGVIYFVLAWALSYGWVSLEKKDKQLIIIFLSTTLIYCCVLIASPMAYKVRTYFGGIFFLYIALPFILYAVFDNIKKLGKLSYLLIASYIIFFLFSYGCVFRAYLVLYKQEQIRLSVITKKIKQGEETIHIPSYYGLYTVKGSDLPALEFEYWEPNELAKYYNIKRIITDTIAFEYEKIINNPTYCMNPQEEGGLKCIYTNKESTETKIILEFMPEISTYYGYQTRFSAKVFTLGKDEKVNYYINLPMRIVKIDDRYFSVGNVLTNFLNEDNPQQKAFVQLNDMKDEIKQLSIPTYKIKLN